MPHQFKWLALLPLPASNVFSLYGMLFDHWSVADVFFWFWFELLILGLAVIALSFLWSRAEREKPERTSANGFAPYLVIFAFVLVLFYASLFSAIAYKGEWKSWDRFPEFLADKKIGLIATVLVTGACFVNTVVKKNYGPDDANKIVPVFMRRALVVVATYAILMFQYHFTGARRVDPSPQYLLQMGFLLLTLKFLAELGLFDRFVKRGKKNPPVVAGI